MMAKFGDFKLNRAGAKSAILVGNGKLQNLERTVAEQMLGNITAQFFQQFGVEGRFEVIGFTTDRSTYKVSAADRQTAAVLKKHPKWLDQFAQNITI